MKILLTHPGTQYAPLLAAQLHSAEILYKFVTGIAFGDAPQAPFWKLIKVLGKEEFASRRLIKGVPSDKLCRIPFLELKALIRVAIKLDQDEIFFERNAAFQKQIPQRLINNADIIIGFDTCSWILAERCKKAGKPFIMDASIAHPLAKEKIFENLRKRFPAWNNEIKPKRDINVEVELKEMEMADHIVAATSFTKNTYTANGIPEHKISINPYGTDLSFFTAKTSYRHPSQEKSHQSAAVNFYFFGAISARKGFPWLCEVWSRLHDRYPGCRLIAAGYGAVPEGYKLPAGLECIGAVHPADRTSFFQAADVFVFPSFFEGFAQVIIEAMACGLPVITTTNTVGPEIIDEGKEGFVIEPGDDVKLFNAMEYFIQNPDQIEPMGKSARKRVLPLTWDAYGDRWKNIAENVIKNYELNLHD